MLRDLRVLDLSRAVAGPYCTMLLGDFGADVIKVESPEGDMGRVAGLSRVNGHTTYFLAVNRNKRSMVVDLKTDGGRDVLARLVGQADVLVENFRPGVLERLGFSEQRLKELNPNLIVCAISGYGQDGPYRGRKALDLIGQTLTGLASLTGEADGPPMPAGAPLSDILTGLNACIGVLVAVIGSGTRSPGFNAVDVSLIGSTLSALSIEACAFLNTGEVPGRHGSAWFETFPYDVFETSDGWACIGGAGQWQQLCRLLGLDELAEREDLLDVRVRLGERQELKRILAAATRRYTTDELVAKLQEADILCGPVNDLQQAFEDPSIRHAGFRIEMEHPLHGRFSTVDSAPSHWPGGRAAGRKEKPRRPPPLLGEHTLEIMAELGYDPDTIEQACRSGAVAYLPH